MSIDNSEEIKPKKPRATAAWFLLQGLAEVMGTGMLVFLGCSGIVPSLTESPAPHLQICIVFGIAVTLIVQIFGHISGSHINPAVTLAALVYKEITIVTAGTYIFAQFVGAILGYGLLLFMTPTEALYRDKSNMNITHGFCTTVPNPQISTIQGFFSEFFATTFLVFVCCSFWDKKNAGNQDSAPIKFGLSVTGLAVAFGPYSGGSMNPARSFAPAVFTGVWRQHWIYWLGPLTASVLVTYIYKFIFDRDRGRSTLDQAELPLNRLNSKVQNLEKVSTKDVP